MRGSQVLPLPKGDGGGNIFGHADGGGHKQRLKISHGSLTFSSYDT